MSQCGTQNPVRRKTSTQPKIDNAIICKRTKPKLMIRNHKYANISARVDFTPPLLRGYRGYHNLQRWGNNLATLNAENIRLLMLIRKSQFLRGKVDCNWKIEPHRSQQYYMDRVEFLKRVHRDNMDMYKRIINTRCRVTPTACLNREWCQKKHEIIKLALNTFVLFPLTPQEDMEDTGFAPPPGFIRPRVYMTIGLQGCAVLGELCIELFTDVCPETCQLFIELMDGDAVGHGYVGTCFFRKVPEMYWSGGDVTRNNGFGCYAQRGRIRPIGAENYHFSHSMPGLLSMPVTCDNEVCGIFNITFKPLPQFDLCNIVFGRIIRPSVTYDSMCVLGRPLSSYPVVEIRSTRRKLNGRWVTGEANTRIKQDLRQRRK